MGRQELHAPGLAADIVAGHVRLEVAVRETEDQVCTPGRERRRPICEVTLGVIVKLTRECKEGRR